MVNVIVCVDAGIVIKQVMSSEDKVVHELWDDWFAKGVSVISPSLLMYEVANVLHRYGQQASGLSGSVINAALAAALALPIRIVDDRKLHLSAIDVARRYGMPATYDAHYVALAERESAILWTTNQRLARRLQESGVDFVRRVDG